MRRHPASLDPSSIAHKLLAYCSANDWAGHDPYDALNSRWLAALPWMDARIPRLVLTQALKRSPINFRRLALIPKTQNPKALALFLSAFLRMPSLGEARRTELVDHMIDRLIALRSPGPHWCWGYSFPWQTRTVVVPRATPNLVCTTFVADALLDAYEHGCGLECLEMAMSAGDYFVTELYRPGNSGVSSFSYPLPSNTVPIHNANLLAAAFLCRLHAIVGEARFLGPALDAAHYSTSRQQADGSWDYGEHPTLRWIDNFHTGYNLCALRSLARSTGLPEFTRSLQRGHEFYRASFIRADGAPRYFHNRTYPIDIHAVAQTIITLLTLKDLHPANVGLARWVFAWATEHMWDDRGFFYYRVLRSCVIRTSYMRWSQAWMLLATAMLLDESYRAPLQASAQPSMTLA